MKKTEEGKERVAVIDEVTEFVQSLSEEEQKAVATFVQGAKFARDLSRNTA